MANLLADLRRKASFLKATFERDHLKAEQQVCEYVEELLNLERENENITFDIDGIKQLIAGDTTFEEFCQTVRNYDDSPLCGCVWTAHFVAYRCKTCATSPCMSICAGCFERGGHEGHDYNIFRSEAGGACDCGDASVMAKEGFCSRHGPNRIVPSSIPLKYIGIGKFFIRHLILTAINLLRSYGKEIQHHTSSPLPVRGKLDDLLDLLLELLKLGSPIREFVSHFIRDEKVYQDLNQDFPSPVMMAPTMQSFHKKSFAWFRDSVRVNFSEEKYSCNKNKRTRVKKNKTNKDKDSSSREANSSTTSMMSTTPVSFLSFESSKTSEEGSVYVPMKSINKLEDRTKYEPVAVQPCNSQCNSFEKIAEKHTERTQDIIKPITLSPVQNTCKGRLNAIGLSKKKFTSVSICSPRTLRLGLSRNAKIPSLHKKLTDT